RPRLSSNACILADAAAGGTGIQALAGLEPVPPDRGYLGEIVDVLQELSPGLGRVGLLLLDPLEGGRRKVLDVTLMRSEDLRLQPKRRVGEDAADRSVAEERVLEVLHRSALQQGRLARQVAGLLEDVRLGGRRGQELDEVGRLVRVRGLLRDGEERAAPVAAGSGRGGDI